MILPLKVKLKNQDLHDSYRASQEKKMQSLDGAIF